MCLHSFAFCISDEQERPDIATGFVRAAGVHEALDKIGDRRANDFVLPIGFRWPADAEGLDVYCTTDVAARELNSLSVPES